jgi:hypothetical protein
MLRNVALDTHRAAYVGFYFVGGALVRNVTMVNPIPLICDSSVTTTAVSQLQECQNYNSVTTTTVSQLQQCHDSKCVIFLERLMKVLKCYNFLRVQQWHNCPPAASFEKCIMTLYLLKVHLQTFVSTPITQKCQILSCDTLVANERYVM